MDTPKMVTAPPIAALLAFGACFMFPSLVCAPAGSSEAEANTRESVEIDEPNFKFTIDRERNEFERANAAFEAGNIVEVTGETVASFTLSNGNIVRFVAVPDDREVAVVEVVPNGSVPVAQQNQKRSPLATYLALAPADAPIPRALVANARPEEAKKLVPGRSITPGFVSDRYVDVDRLDLDITAAPQTVGGVGYCTPSSFGAFYFMVHTCKSQNLQTSFCDPGNLIPNVQWNWTTLIRQSSSKTLGSYGRTAACGGTGEQVHYYWSGPQHTWKWVKIIDVPHNGQVWKSYVGWSKRYRRVKHRTFHPNVGGFVRAWTEF